MRPLLLLLVLLPLAIGALAAFAWVRAGQDRYEALEQEGLALAQVVRGAAQDASATLTSAEANLADRLASVARRADAAVARTRAPASEVLRPIAAEERVGRIFLFGADGEPVARIQHPAPVPGTGEALLTQERKEAAEWREAGGALRVGSPAAGGVRVEGMRTNVFGTRDRFGVLFGRPGGGTLLLRASAEEIAELRARFGLHPVLDRVVRVPQVQGVRLWASDGSVRMQRGAVGVDEGAPVVPGTEGVVQLDGPLLRALVPVALLGETLVIDLALSRERADAAVGKSRRSILLGALLALVLALGGGVLLLVREAAVRRANAAAAAHIEEERRLAEMGALAGLVTHEVSNPMNAIRMALGVLEDRHTGGEPDEILEIMKAEVERVRRTLDGYMALAGSDRRGRTAVTPGVLQRVRDGVLREADLAAVSLQLEVAPGAADALANAIVLEQALLNLTRNAVQASPQGGDVTLRWESVDGAPTILVTDTGPGFPADRAGLLKLGGVHREGGHGLGLPLAKRFIEAHGGRMELEDAPGGGARVRVTLPPAGEDTARDA